MNRHPLSTQTLRTGVSLALLALCLCSLQEDEISRTNPFDPGGDNWTRDAVPVVRSVSIDSSPLWSDFDFDNSTGSIDVIVHASDANQEYDSLSYRILLGPSNDSLDTIHVTTDSFFTFNELALATTYFYRIEVSDTWDSTTVHEGRFVTPSGTPPPRPSSTAHVYNGESYIRVSWSVTPGVPYGYRLYATTDPHAVPFTSRFESDVGSNTTSLYYRDSIGDYEPRYYLIATRNQYGESRGQDTLFGRCYSSIYGTPSGVVATTENCYTIKVSWSHSSYSTAVAFDIFRREASASYYRIVRRMPASGTSYSASYTYHDTLPSPANPYYRIAAVYSGGIPSEMSSDSAMPRSTLSPPSSVSATDGAHRHYVLVNWSPRSGATGYSVYRSRGACPYYSSSDTMVFIASTDSTFFRDSVPEQDQTYCYRVASLDSCGRPGYRSSSTSGYRAALRTPTSLSASDGTYRAYVRLSWNSVSEVSGYVIYRSVTYGGLGAADPLDTASSTVYNDTTPTCDRYYYQVAALDRDGTLSPRSSYDRGNRSGPPPPSSLSASDGTHEGCIVVTWERVSEAMSYVLYRADSSSSATYIVLDTVLAETYRDSSVRTHLDYFYRLATVDSTGLVGQRSINERGYVRRIGTPNSVHASRGTYAAYIRITWNPVTEAAGYRIYRSNYTGGPFVQVASTTDTCHNDVVDRERYIYYRVSAYDSSGNEGKQSASAMGYLRDWSAPSRVTASQDRYEDSIVVTWDSMPAADHYRVYRSSSSSYNATYTQVATVSAARYADTVLSTRSVYYYKVSAYSTTRGETPRSSSVTGSAIRSAPEAPTIVASEGDYESITVVWQPNTAGPPPHGYYVYRASSSTLGYTRIDTTTDTCYVDSICSSGSRYYKVSAYNSYGEGLLSSYEEASTRTLRAPRDLSASDSTYQTHVLLTWSAVDGAVAYNVYRDGPNAYSPLATTTETAYNDSTGPSEPVRYRVAAVAECGRLGEFSEYEWGSR